MTNVLIKTTETVQHWSTFFSLSFHSFPLPVFTSHQEPVDNVHGQLAQAGFFGWLCKVGREEQHCLIFNRLPHMLEVHEKDGAPLGIPETPSAPEATRVQWRRMVYVSQGEAPKSTEHLPPMVSACPLTPSRQQGPCQPRVMGDPAGCPPVSRTCPSL